MTKKDTTYTAKLKNINPLNMLFGGDDNENETINATEKSVAIIPIAVIQLPLTQPRKYFDPKKLQELALSIKEIGILEPLIVRPISEKHYELIAGERRLKAAMMAGLEEVSVVIKEMDDNLVKQVQLIENLQREDLNAYEETVGILELLSLRLSKNQEGVISLLNWMDKANRKRADNVIRHSGEQDSDCAERSAGGNHQDDSSPITDDTLADNVIRQSEREVVESVFASLGRLSAESFRANRLPLLKLPQDIQEALQRGAIEYTKARAIAKLKDSEARSFLLQTAIEENLSLTEIQVRIQQNLQQKEEEVLSLKTQYKELTRKLGASKIWSNEEKREAVEKLLEQIKALLEL